MKSNSIIKSSTFCLQQNWLTELTPKAPFDASSGIRLRKVYKQSICFGYLNTCELLTYTIILILVQGIIAESVHAKKKNHNSYNKSQSFPDNHIINKFFVSKCVRFFQFA